MYPLEGNVVVDICKCIWRLSSTTNVFKIYECYLSYKWLFHSSSICDIVTSYALFWILYKADIFKDYISCPIVIKEWKFKLQECFISKAGLGEQCNNKKSRVFYLLDSDKSEWLFKSIWIKAQCIIYETIVKTVERG